jgi:hypothetical protein
LRKIVFFLIISLVLGALSRLGWIGREKQLSGAEREAVLAYSEPITDSLFAGLAADDYAAFSRDFDGYMQKTLPEAGFPAWKQDLDSQFGSYLTRAVEEVRKSDEFYVVDYQVRFEKAEPVKVTVVFHAAGTHLISMLGFEAEKPEQK